MNIFSRAPSLIDFLFLFLIGEFRRLGITSISGKIIVEPSRRSAKGVSFSSVGSKGKTVFSRKQLPRPSCMPWSGETEQCYRTEFWAVG